jgi:hypothetical protein
VDELGSFETAVDRALRLAGIPSANLVRYQRTFYLGNLFRLLGEAKQNKVEIDVGLKFPQLEAGRLYFLSPTVLH